MLERLARLYMANGQSNKARECFEELVRQKPNDPETIKALKDSTALDTMNKGGWDGADSYRDVMKDTEEAAVLEKQAKAVKSDSDVDSLIAETLQRIEQEPENVNYRRALADPRAAQTARPAPALLVPHL